MLGIYMVVGVVVALVSRCKDSDILSFKSPSIN